jgi:hypothetical protein
MLATATDGVERTWHSDRFWSLSEVQQTFVLPRQDTIVAEFQGMVTRLNGIFDEKAALLASLGQPHEAGPANLVRVHRQSTSELQ